ncbi:MAG: DnaJ domain-containing protein [Lachnospiraceae bacterium]|nr:DnaJ domain-containing protein [Lachnospiraceae bacterium]
MSNASSEEIKNAYKQLSKRYHPDVVGDVSTEMFARINEAYDFLMNNPAPSRKVLGNDESAMVRYASRRTNRDMAKKYEFKEKQRKREKEAELKKASLEARQRKEEERKRQIELEKEKERQVRAMEMAIIISKMLGEKK